MISSEPDIGGTGDKETGAAPGPTGSRAQSWGLAICCCLLCVVALMTLPQLWRALWTLLAEIFPNVAVPLLSGAGFLLVAIFAPAMRRALAWLMPVLLLLCIASSVRVFGKQNADHQWRLRSNASSRLVDLARDNPERWARTTGFLYLSIEDIYHGRPLFRRDEATMAHIYLVSAARVLDDRVVSFDDSLSPEEVAKLLLFPNERRKDESGREFVLVLPEAQEGAADPVYLMRSEGLLFLVPRERMPAGRAVP